MKKIILFLLLIPFLGFAKYIKATVTMNDNSVKNGYIKFPEYQDDIELKFRYEQNGKTEKLYINDLKQFEFLNDRNETITYITMFLAQHLSFKKDKLNIDKTKSWVNKVNNGKINIYHYYSAGFAGFQSTGPIGGTFDSSPASREYYIQKPGDYYAILFDVNYGRGTSWPKKNHMEFLKNIITKIFENDCPQLADLVTDENFVEYFKKNNYTIIEEFYEKNCGK